MFVLTHTRYEERAMLSVGLRLHLSSSPPLRPILYFFCAFTSLTFLFIFFVFLGAFFFLLGFSLSSFECMISNPFFQVPACPTVGSS